MAIINVATGTTATELQSIIDDAPAGSTIHLASGQFTFDRTINITRDNITVEGSGSGQTRILSDFDSGEEGPVFAIHGDGVSGTFRLQHDVSEGARSLQLGSGHGFEAGDFVWLERPNTDEFFREIGDEEWRQDKPLRTSIARVTEVNGNTLTLENGVHFDFDSSDATVRKLEMAENVTLKGFSIDTSLGEPDPADFTNNESAFDFVAAIDLDGTYKARLSDIEAHDSGSKAFLFKKTLAMTATDLLADGTHNKGTGGNGYAFELKEVYESSLTGLEDHGMRHSVIFGSWYSAVNNTIQVDYTDRDINVHGGRHHNNTVHVDVSERQTGADNLSSVVSYNSEGERWGAPVEAGANVITFGRVLGSKRPDDVQADNTGVLIDGRGADDTLHGGSGADTLVGGDGDDQLLGGGGVDTAQFSGSRDDYDVSVQSGNRLSVDGEDGTDLLQGVEWLRFDGQMVSAASFGIDVDDNGEPPAPEPEEPPVVGGGDGDGDGEGGSEEPPVVGGGDGDGDGEGEGGSEEPPVVGGGDGDGDGEGDPDDGGSETPPVTEALVGTQGNDVFLVEKTGISVDARGGFDHIQASVSFAMSANAEKLTLTGNDDIDATGNDARNIMRGNAGNNLVDGGGGDDRLWARSGDDQIAGEAGNDELNGQSGDDVLQGGSGMDWLSGGSGADRFRFDGVQDSSGSAVDTIADFNQKQGDKIDLAAFDANSTQSGHQSFAFIGTANFSGKAGELRFDDNHLQGDVDGDGSVDFDVDISGVSQLAQDDIVT